MDIMNTKYVTLGEKKASSTVPLEDELASNLEAANNYLKAIEKILKTDSSHNMVFTPTATSDQDAKA